MSKYKKYRCQFEHGATVTVFAPYDCGNNCPFCVNKKEYKENPNFDIDAVCRSIGMMHEITPHCDYVITGGEPLAELDAFDRILNAVPEGHKLFLNTTLPAQKVSIEELAAFLNARKDKITEINCSRHIRKYVDESDDSIFDMLEIPVRINCVLFKAEEGMGALSTLTRFEKRRSIEGVQFRENYRTTTKENLYLFNEEERTFECVLESLCGRKTDPESYFKEHVVSQNDFRWNCAIPLDSKLKISYHRTLPYSTLVLDDGSMEINDIIINPRGLILNDWNEYGQVLDLKLYRAAFTD